MKKIMYTVTKTGMQTFSSAEIAFLEAYFEGLVVIPIYGNFVAVKSKDLLDPADAEDCQGFHLSDLISETQKKFVHDFKQVVDGDLEAVA